MFPKPSIAYRVTLPDGSSFYAANTIVLDPKDAQPPVSVPAGVYLYIVDTNTFMRGYSFFGKEPRGDSTEDRMVLRCYLPDVERYTERPIVFHIAGRDQVEGDDSSPAEFTEPELDDPSLIQTTLVMLLERPDTEQSLADKSTEGTSA